MKILVADDEPISRTLLARGVKDAGYDVVLARDGDEAWEALRAPSAPRLALLDWMMPGMDGPEVCRRVRSRGAAPYTWIALVTSRADRGDVLEGLEAGADDFVSKPFDLAELRARVRTGERIVSLQAALGEKLRELEAAIAHVRKLQGLLPICMFCKSIRTQREVWQRLEEYLEANSDATFTHSICENCLHERYPED